MTGLGRTARRIQSGYAPDTARPLGGYLTLIGVYVGSVGAMAAAARLTGRRLPSRIRPGDAVLLTIGTYKLSRVVTKDSVTSALRAPFTRYQEPAGEGEVNDRPRGSGLRHAVGELLTCPFCASVWVATGLAGGLVFAPRFTRWVAGVASAVAGADALQLGYHRLRRAAARE
jgi:hypothetical protein